MSDLFDPLEPARGTNCLQVESVYRCSNKEIIDVRKWLSTQTLGSIHKLRVKIRTEELKDEFKCFYCGHDVLLRKHERGGHYFAHKEKSAAEKQACIYQQERQISMEDRDRIRYHGQREGQQHIRIKEYIENILNVDVSCIDTRVEKVWTTFLDGWRKPDVSTLWNNIRIVFEVQVSNTYPQVVAERTDFYRKQGAILIWIFKDVLDSNWRTMHADAFCSNEQTLFFVDDECLNHSIKTKLAHFKVYLQYPDVQPIKNADNGRWYLEIFQKEEVRLVPFSELSFNIDHQTATPIDLEQLSSSAVHKLTCAEAQASWNFEPLKDSIRELIGNDKREITMSTLHGWAALVCGIESMRLGTPIGTKYSNPVEVLNLIYDHHPQFISHLIDSLDRLSIDPHEKRSGAWRARCEDFYKGRYKNGPLPEQHNQSYSLLKHIYPN